MLYTMHYESPLGGILLAADDAGLTGLWFDGAKYFADGLAREHAELETPVLAEAAHKLVLSQMSAQAVGGAVGHNRISLIIPCHRVVGADGSMTGYAGGIERKRRLLELEGVDMSRLYLPKKGTAVG